MKSTMGSKNKRHGRSKGADCNPSANRVCRVEELEKREYLAADPISVGVVYTEQYTENLGDNFYVAWVGGEEGCTTLDTLVVNLDKNENGRLDEGEACFDVAGNGEVYSYVPFTLVDKTDDIGYKFNVEDGGMVLTISFTNFHEGDHFVFCLDLDEYQPSSTNNAQVEGGEMGGSINPDGSVLLPGSFVSATFTSTHYETEDWTGMFVDYYDVEYGRPDALADAYPSSLLPYDVDDGNEGIAQAGVYSKIDLTPKPIVVSGYVYEDHDVDCNYDVNDEDRPIANVEVTLVGEEGQKWTTTTDVNGYYEFGQDLDLLPGSYKIFSQADIISPEGYQYADFCAKGGEFGKKITPLEIDVTGMEGGDVAPNNNFAKVLPGSISGHVFEDRNNADGKNEGESWDGIQYPAAVELYRVQIDKDGKPVYTLMETQTVDETGYYEFVLDCSYNADGTLRKLPGRTYELREVFDSPDYSDGNDYIGSLGGKVSNDVFSEIFVGYDEHGVNYDFGELKLGSIAGNVYEDRNDNGIFEDSEIGIAGVTVDLYQWDGSKYVWIAKTETDKDGSYEFDNLNIIYDYAVKERQPSDYADGKDSVGTLGGKVSDDYIYDVNVGWDQHGYEYNFGELKLGSIAGNVYEDRNNNGVFEDNEIGIAEVTIELYRWNGSDYDKVTETKTDENGAYRFDNLPINQQYAVREKQPTEYSDGKDSIGSLGGEFGQNDEIRSIDVQWDDHGVEYNFGELKLGSVSGYVYHDANDDGNFDENEDPIADVVVELYRLNGNSYAKVAETTTNVDGFYKFDNLDINQTYAVKEIQPKEWNDGKDSVGTLGGDNSENDFTKNIRVLWDQHGKQYNFGELAPVGSLSGYVYEDDNDNGVKNDGEAGIANVTVQLYEIGEDNLVKLVATQYTDETGFYKFDNLTPNKTYVIRETQPTKYYDGKDAVGTIFGAVVGEQVKNDELTNILLPNNGQGVHYDFGELRPGSLSGFVYVDRNDNGIKESDEAGIPNTTVTLLVLNETTGEYENTNKVVLTDSLGHYVFDNLQPCRIYKIVETQPSSYIDGKDTIGSLGGDVANDVFSNVKVMPGEDGVEYNFGEKLPKDDPVIPDPVPPRPINVVNNTWGAAPTYFPYVFYQPVVPGSMTTLYGGGGFVEQNAWHLSTLNDAMPKDQSVAYSHVGFRNDLGTDEQVVVHTTHSNVLTVKFDSKLIILNLGENSTTSDFSVRCGRDLKNPKLIVGDWNGDGKDYVGIFDDGSWFLDRNGDGVWDGDDILAELGSGSDQPVCGDWDGDGKIDIGVFGTRWEHDSIFLNAEKGLPADLKSYSVVSDEGVKVSENSVFKEGKTSISDNELVSDAAHRKLTRLVWKKGVNIESADKGRWDVLDHVFEYGTPGDTAITGDWTGDGRTKIGVYRNGEWFLDIDGDGKWSDGDWHFTSSVEANYKPVVGDFNGDGVDTLGYFHNGTWLLDVEGDGNFQEYKLGQEGDVPITGDWDGDGVDGIGVMTSQTSNVPVDSNADVDSSTISYDIPRY